LSDNIYSGTNSLLGTGIQWFPYFELTHLPSESNLFIGSFYFDFFTPIGSFSAKPTFISQNPWFSSVSVFWDLYPIIAGLSYGSFKEHRDGSEDNRRKLLETGEGMMIKAGIGYEYLYNYPF